VLALVAERQSARAAKDWPKADSVRQQLAALGWQVKDTPQGPEIAKVESGK
jgi:cysteinyl-tRNA synthetase